VLFTRLSVQSPELSFCFWELQVFNNECCRRFAFFLDVKVAGLNHLRRLAAGEMFTSLRPTSHHRGGGDIGDYGSDHFQLPRSSTSAGPSCALAIFYGGTLGALFCDGRDSSMNTLYFLSLMALRLLVSGLHITLYLLVCMKQQRAQSPVAASCIFCRRLALPMSRHGAFEVVLCERNYVKICVAATYGSNRAYDRNPHVGTPLNSL
jgi:hypothetical protein